MTVEGTEHEPTSMNLYNQIIDKTRRRHRLISAHWELTYRCNEKCTHCYLDVLPPNADVPGELTTADCIRVLDDLAQLGVLNLTFSGGEILARRDFFQIAEYARSKEFLLRLFTNGILIKSEMADRIAALHPYAVELSLYSTKAEVHDGITRVHRSWELTTRAFRLLHERGVRTVMKTPLMRENVREIDALAALAKELGAQFKFDPTITAKDSGSLDPLKHRLTFADLVWLFQQKMETSAWVNRDLKPEQHTCGIASNSLLIDPIGNVFPCVSVRAKAGNVRTQSLREIWEQSSIWARLGAITLNELPVCRTCELRNLCVRCHGLARNEQGDLTAPALANCREALARRQVLVDRGVLPTDYPIPIHLQELYSQETGGNRAIASDFQIHCIYPYDLTLLYDSIASDERQIASVKPK